MLIWRTVVNMGLYLANRLRQWCKLIFMQIIQIKSTADYPDEYKGPSAPLRHVQEDPLLASF